MVTDPQLTGGQWRRFMPYGLLVAMGQAPNMGKVRKFGYNGSVGGTEETISDVEELLTYPSAATQIKVSSTSADDTAAGTGAQTVTLYGLDGDYLEIEETVPLDGQTEVLTLASFLRTTRARVRSAGSGGGNAGKIWFGDGTVTAGVPATKHLAISVGENRTLHAAWTVPAGKELYLVGGLDSSFGNQNVFATIRLVARPLGGVFEVLDKFTLTRADVLAPEEIPEKFDAKTDIEVRAFSSGADIDVSAKFGGYVRTLV